MRFTTAWSEVSSQNVTLKVAVASLTLMSLLLSIALVRVSLKDPLMIERGCYSKAVEKAESNHSQKEITAFLEEALKQRFNSEVGVVPGFLSQAEEEFRRQEQEKLKNSQMVQKIIVNKIQIGKNRTTIDADRLISVGSIRSAFPFPLDVLVASTYRHESNPYGLQLVKVTSLTKVEKKE